jgi:hypothetical protein
VLVTFLRQWKKLKTMFMLSLGVFLRILGANINIFITNNKLEPTVRNHKGPLIVNSVLIL